MTDKQASNAAVVRVVDAFMGKLSPDPFAPVRLEAAEGRYDGRLTERLTEMVDVAFSRAKSDDDRAEEEADKVAPGGCTHPKACAWCDALGVALERIQTPDPDEAYDRSVERALEERGRP